MKRLVRDFANKLRAKAAIRRERFLKRAVDTKQDDEAKNAGEWFGEPLDLHIVPLAGRRNPRGRDGRHL
jgi:hypothetical protein